MIKTNTMVPHRRRRMRIPAVETTFNEMTGRVENRSVCLELQKSYSPESASAEIERWCDIQRGMRKGGAS